MAEAYTTEDKPEVQQDPAECQLDLVWKKNKRTALPVVRQKYLAEKHAVIERILHKMQYPVHTPPVLRNDVIDALVVVEAPRKHSGDKRSV